MLCIETSTSSGSLQTFEGAAGEFKEALGSQLQIISSPADVGKDGDYVKNTLSRTELSITEKENQAGIY